MMKLRIVMPYLKKILKIHKSRNTLLEFCAISYWSSANFVISINTDKDCISMHNSQFFLTLFESLKVFLMNMVAILMIPVK